MATWGKDYQIAREAMQPGLRGGVVRVEERLDGRLAVRFRHGYLTIAPCEPRARLDEEVKFRPPAIDTRTLRTVTRI